jgi:murein DD-endopeptidase MepM/ murein hydrolase activator NlpD
LRDGRASGKHPNVPPSRHLRLLLLAVPVAVLVLLSSTDRTPPLAPISEVRGVVATPPPSLTIGPGPALVREFAYSRPTDPDGPGTGAARLPPAPSRLTGYIWPLVHGRITLPFKAIPGGSRIKDGLLWHDGVDLASFCGDRVRAAHDGVVLAAGRHFDDYIGWVGDLSRYYALLDRKSMWNDLPLAVVIDDGDGYRSIYAHFGTVVVRVGDVVHAGQLIGYEGMTGHASGCHVHFGLFSPREPTTFGVRADILHNLRLPPYEIARIDPLDVLPGGQAALRTRLIPGTTVAPATKPVTVPKK